MRSQSAEFEGVLDRYFESTLKANPQSATYAGLKSGEGKLGRADLSAEIQQQKQRQTALKKLDNIAPTDLSNEQHLDRLALRSLLLREEEEFLRKRPQLEPKHIEQLLNILLHELLRGEDEPARAARNIRSLLKEAPRYLDEGRELVREPEQIWRKIMDLSFQGAQPLFQAVEKFLAANVPKKTDGDLLRGAFRAAEIYRDAILEGPTARRGAFSVGADLLQRRVRDDLGLDYSLGQVERLALREVDRVSALLAQACSKFGRKTADQIIAQARAEWDPGPDLLQLYRTETKRVADRFQQARAMTFPKGDKLEVRPVPEFLRHLLPTAAYSAPGPFDPKQRGIFWVNDLSATKSSEEEKRAERAQHFGLPLTCAHEAYPGHHLQFITANRHPRKWRRLFAHAVFYEGWTLWCEQMMVDLRIDRSRWLPVQQLHDALWRCHRILIDLRLQTGRYSYEQATAHLRKHLGFTQARAEADVNWYAGQPGTPMSYWLGRLENERLRRRLMEGRKWSLKQFNDWLLSFGTLPQAWIEKYGLG